MIRFTKLLTQLIFCSSNKDKIKIITNYFNYVDNVEAGYTVAALTNNLKFDNVKASNVKEIIKKYVDSTLFDLSYDYVGDIADTISLIWKQKQFNNNGDETIYEVVVSLSDKKIDLEKYIVNFLNRNDVDVRWAFIKLLLGGYRVGVSTNFIKNTLAIYGNKKISEIENIWNGLVPPYIDLIKWLKNVGEYPRIKISETFHSMMLANSFDLKKHSEKINNEDYTAEYKWDGIRIQISCKDNITKVFSRNGDEITHSFPEINIKSKKIISTRWRAFSWQRI